MSRAVWQLGQAVRECGIALERAGARLSTDFSFTEPLSRHREILGLTNHKPTINEGCFIAPTAGVSGEVNLGAGSSVWYGAFVKGDRSKVTIGSNTSILEGAVIQGGTGPVTIGNDATIGQGAVIRAAIIGNGAIIGTKSSVGNGAVVEAGAAVAPGSHVADNTTVPTGSLFSGNPAVFLRKLSDAEISAMSKVSASTQKMAPTHAAECNKTFAQIEVEKSGYIWQVKKPNTDPLGLLTEQKAVHW
mmetsp:Transcript_38831/g.32779  ORF Transcript_38831/g.32779 Transcript_38831/m.32779 type:complete len:246 (-) Transcript_38831:526-1263(-)